MREPEQHFRTDVAVAERQSLLARSLDQLERMPTWAITALALALTLVIGVADYAVGVEISLSVFYVIPIALVTWYGGSGRGLLLAAVNSVAMWEFSWLAGQHFANPLAPYWNALARFGFFAVEVWTLIALRRVLRRESASARHDSLTGLHNARAFHELAERELRRAERYGYPLAVAYLDVDGFKAINDRFGHRAGDRALSAIGRALSMNTRATDIAARVGGDEFVLFLPDTDAAAAAAVLEKLVSLITDGGSGEGWPLRLSVGVVTCRRAGGSIEELVHCADTVMYNAKQSGRGGVLCEAYPSAGHAA